MAGSESADKSLGIVFGLGWWGIFCLLGLVFHQPISSGECLLWIFITLVGWEWHHEYLLKKQYKTLATRMAVITILVPVVIFIIGLFFLSDLRTL
jgi:ACR3 family arsenite efflux pump ArsB